MWTKIISFLIALLVFGLVGLGNAGPVNLHIKRIKVFDAVTIAASGDSSSRAINLDRFVSNGFFSIHYTLTGDGTAKFEYLSSNDGVNFLEPSGASDIGSALTKTSGPGSDGKDILPFYPAVTNSMKIKVTETGGANTITMTVWLVMH